MDKQEIFDTAVLGIIKQGKPSMYMDTCVYRHPDGMKCAVGHLIPDEMYSSSLEGATITYLRDNKKGKNLPEYMFKEDNFNLLSSLQVAHDSNAQQDGVDEQFIRLFIEQAKHVATVHDLSMDKVEAYLKE